MKHLLTAFFILTSFFKLGAQQISFEKSFDTLGCYYANCVRQTLDGGYIMCGSNYSASAAQDAAIIKTDSIGNILWLKTYGGISTDGALSIKQTSDSGYIVVAIKDAVSINDSKTWLLKLDALGDTLWTKTITFGLGNNFPTEVTQALDGGYAICGYTSGRGSGGYDAFLIKTNSLGDTVWARTYGDSGNEVSYALAQANDSGYVITGAKEDSNGIYDVYIVKADVNGDTVWTRTYGGSNADFGRSIVQTVDSGFIVAGTTINLQTTFNNGYLLKLDAMGDTSWTKSFGDSREAGFYSVGQTQDGGYILGGLIVNSSPFDQSAWLVKVNDIGDSIWTRQYGGSSGDNCYSVQQTFDGGYVFAGESDSFTPNSIYFVKTDSIGSIATGIPELPLSKSALIVYPNPNSGVFTLHLRTFMFNGYQINIYDSQGVLVLSKQSKELVDNIQVDMTTFSSGMYFISIKSSNEIMSKQIVINH